jgi:hypothetical protein
MVCKSQALSNLPGLSDTHAESCWVAVSDNLLDNDTFTNRISTKVTITLSNITAFKPQCKTDILI